MSFDDAVKQAKGEIKVEEPIPKVKRGIHCIPITNSAEDLNDKWPTSFYFSPQVGDVVMSKNGRVLYVVNIVHRVGAVEVQLGRSVTKIDPKGG